MNIAATEVPLQVLAKVCGCNNYYRKVIYSFVDQYHSLCVDKLDILSAQLNACKILLSNTNDINDKKIIQNEIHYLERFISK